MNVGCTDNSKVLTSEVGKGISIAIGKLEELVKVRNTVKFIEWHNWNYYSYLKIERPQVDLILAVPRPLRLERLLSVVSCQGVGRIILIGAKKVEKDFFGR